MSIPNLKKIQNLLKIACRGFSDEPALDKEILILLSGNIVGKVTPSLDPS